MKPKQSKSVVAKTKRKAVVRRSPKAARAGYVTEKEEAAYAEAKLNHKKQGKLVVTSLFNLNPNTERKIESMAYRQVQTTSQLTKTNDRVSALTASVEQLAQVVEAQLRRIKVAATEPENPVFATRCFNKISIRLRKRAVDVQIEDIHQGAKRRRLFRCDSYSKVEHLLTQRTIVEGIEEIVVAATTKKSAGKPKGKKGRPSSKKPQSLADVRHIMERDGIPNSIIPTKEEKLFSQKASIVSVTANRNREKAEKLIVKLCSPGKPYEDASDEELVDALVDNGFAPAVAFAAASNCGRITKRGLESAYSSTKVTSNRSGNEY